MTDKPTAVGYVNANLLNTDSELERVRMEVARFASERGYALTYIHIEDRGSTPEAFTGLVQQVTALDITTVLIPSLLHFAGLGSPVDVKSRLEHLIGGRVIPISSPSSGVAGVLIPASAPVTPTIPRPCPGLVLTPLGKGAVMSRPDERTADAEAHPAIAPAVPHVSGQGLEARPENLIRNGKVVTEPEHEPCPGCGGTGWVIG